MMRKTSLTTITRNIRIAMKKHSPEILTGIGIAGMITTTVMAVQATPKALILIEEKKNDEHTDKLTPVETVKAAWVCYIPAAVTGVMSVVCLVGASSVNARRNAALATAYTLSESALKGYREKVIETIGEKKERDVRDTIAKDQVTKNPVIGREIIITDRGNTLCLDVLSKRYFKSDIDKIRKAENELNRQMRDEMFISLNEFYDELGLDHIEIGDDFGWDIDNGYIDLDFSSQLTDDGTPCLVIGHNNKPDYRYH